MWRNWSAVVFAAAGTAGAVCIARRISRRTRERGGGIAGYDPDRLKVSDHRVPPVDRRTREHSELVATPQEIALVERIEASFRDVYLTLISIIQGVAFSFVAERAFAPPNPNREEWIAYAICFVMIVVVWQEYMVGATVFTWTPTLLDAAVPFGVGIAEFLLIVGARLSTQTFLIRFAILLGAGVVGYGNWLFHAIYGGELNKISYATLSRYVWFGTVMCFVVFLLSVCLAWAHAAAFTDGDAIYLSLALALILPLSLHSILNWSMPLHLIHVAKRGPQSRSQAAAEARTAAEAVSSSASVRLMSKIYLRVIADALKARAMIPWRRSIRRRGTGASSRRAPRSGRRVRA